MKEHMPVFSHDCEQCIFLENFLGADLYFCPSILLGGSLIARDGDEGPDYSSMPKGLMKTLVDKGDAQSPDPRLLRAYEIVEERKL